MIFPGTFLYSLVIYLDKISVPLLRLRAGRRNEHTRMMRNGKQAAPASPSAAESDVSSERPQMRSSGIR